MKKLHTEKEELISKINSVQSLSDIKLLNQLVEKILPVNYVTGVEVHGPDIINPKKKAGIYLRGLRTREDISQSELCLKLNIRQPNLSAWENGREPIPKDKAKKIAKFLGGSLKLLGHS